MYKQRTSYYSRVYSTALNSIASFGMTAATSHSVKSVGSRPGTAAYIARGANIRSLGPADTAVCYSCQLYSVTAGRAPA